ncbi:hypothetical protein KCU81_g7088, partial [Aureobasidium melanogenum]|uniref:Uncharacterized protein n=1 Tax=Aureobasidium melanogenum (strain CBS 110374) TaxID=1043003 RepID=A0A074WFQ9_AURM1
MASNSKVRSRSVNDRPNAVNVARPVRARRRSSQQSQQSSNADESSHKTFADAIAHLLPAAGVVSNSRTATEPVVIEDSDDEAESSAYPVTPVSPVAPTFSPLTPAGVNDEVGADSVREKNTPERSPTRKSKKRKATEEIPATPPPRRLRLRSRQSTATSKTTSEPKKTPIPILKAPKSASTTKGKGRAVSAAESTAQIATSSADDSTVLEGANVPQITNPLLALARNIQNPSDFIHSIIESDALTLDSDQRGPSNAAEKMSALKRRRNRIAMLVHQMLRRQRALIHSYDTYDVQTYNPGDSVDPSTAALRYFVGVLREGLDEVESTCNAILAELDDQINNA